MAFISYFFKWHFCAVIFIVINHQNYIGVDAKPITTNSKAGAFYYLVNYGYIMKDENKNTEALLSEEVVTKAVKDFQVFAGLDPTGKLDNTTVELMNTPRCGVKDHVGPSNRARRKKRYALQGSRWRVDKLTWRITKYPSSGSLSKDEVEAEIKKAFQFWADKTALKFEKKKSGTPHIDIRFEKREHGDGDPFDGVGGTLAHAFFPQYGGDAHFDDQEYWTINSFRGTNILQTAAHEFGHSLGLSHSDVRSALMAPFYKGWEPNLQLDRDDVDAIQALYGAPKPDNVPNPSTTTTQRPAGGGDDNNDLCSDSRVDTIFSTADGSYYVFKGSDYWKLTEDSVESGYPKKIRDDWSGLDDNIDAAVTWTDNDKTYFFKGDEYWKFENMEPDSGYPRKLRDGFSGIPNNVDAAFLWGGNGKIYFFKDDEYWKFDPSRKPPVGSAYPRNIKNWDLPSGITAAVRWSNKHTYFFKHGEYYRFNDRRFTIDEGDPAFPRPSGPWWFGCEKNTKAVKSENGGATFVTKALKKDEASFALTTFDVVGDEFYDVIPSDE